MDEMMYQKSYQEYKAELDGELQRTAEGFVRIGYLLKVARDTNVLATSGYKNVADFAQAEYNLDKTQVSRFISINDKFSEGGYSDRLQADYRNYGYAKLTIMLQLPDEINDLLSPAMSKAEIQTIHEEYKEEMQISDLEVMMEEPLDNKQDAVACGEEQERQQARVYGEGTVLDKAVYMICRNEPEIYEQAFYEMGGSNQSEGIYDAFVPNDEQLFIVRIPAVGKLTVSIKGMSAPVRLVNMRNGEQEEYAWDDVMVAFAKCVPEDTEETINNYDAKKCWEEVYGEPWPIVEQKEEVAPVQQPKAEKPKPKKESKVKVVKKKEPDPVKKEEPAAVKDIMPAEPENPVEQDEKKIIDGEYREIEYGKEENAHENEKNENDIRKNGTEADENVEKTTTEEQWAELKKIFNEILDGYDIVRDYLRDKGWSPLNIQVTMKEYQDVKDVYQNSIDMAAGFEKLMMKMEEWTHGK